MKCRIAPVKVPRGWRRGVVLHLKIEPSIVSNPGDPAASFTGSFAQEFLRRKFCCNFSFAVLTRRQVRPRGQVVGLSSSHFRISFIGGTVARRVAATKSRDLSGTCPLICL